jgi:hypothetical protein
MATADYETVLREAEALSPEEQQRLADTLLKKLAGQTPAPRRSSYGVLAHLGPAPSAEEIDEARREAWANFPRDDIA